MNIYHYNAAIYLNGNVVGNVDGFIDSLEFDDVSDYNIIKDFLMLDILSRDEFRNLDKKSLNIGITSLTIVGKKR